MIARKAPRARSVIPESIVAPSSVSNWSVAGNLEGSAKELARAKEMAKREATEKADQKIAALSSECKRLRKQLKAANKRPREATATPNSTKDAATDENPKKRPSPEPKDKPVGHLVDIMAGATPAEEPGSDDEVEVPESLAELRADRFGPERATVCQKFRALNSIVCHYKLKEIDPKNPSNKNITFTVCADICDDEIKMLSKWYAIPQSHPNKSNRALTELPQFAL